jgi:NAD(P)-dependent dehydrogenase (short-subunit alcohol dehydrogenase family)
MERGGELKSGTVVVTGASSGIGAAAARALAERDYRLVLVSRTTELTSRLAKEVTRASSGDHVALACDVTSVDAVAAAAQTIGEHVGAPFGLVNAAGISLPQRLGELTNENWQRTIDTNLSGTFYMSHAVSTLMAASDVEGSIVNIGSNLTFYGIPAYVAYCASKAGLLGLTKAMAAELAPKIRVNLLCPGPVDTPMLRAEFALEPDPGATWQDAIDHIPLGRIAEPEEIAESICWMLEARWATGSVLSLDGGIVGVRSF